MLKKVLLMALLLHTFFLASFSQEKTVFLSQYDSCHLSAPLQGVAQFDMEAASAFAPRVRVAYIIPSNRTAQSNGVANLQNAIKTGQQYYREQMEQNGFGAKSYAFETEADGETPLIHVVHVSETDDYLRGDIWSRTFMAAINAGITVWAPGEVWVLIPEAHLMLPDGSVIGGVALGASNGTGNSPGVAMIGSNALPLFQPEMITNDTRYDGKVLPALGPFPMKENLTFAWFEGNTFSSVASSWLGALLHEMGHAFGLAHDYRNDNNFHGNLMFNGLRGMRGSLFPDKYPQDYTRLAYSSALILNVSHYFNRNKKVANPPTYGYGPGVMIPNRGVLRIIFNAYDNDSLSLALLRYRGDLVAELALDSTEASGVFEIPYFTQGATNPYTIALYDKQGNMSSSSWTFTALNMVNQAPFPFIQISPPVPGEDQAITLSAVQSYDVDHPTSALKATWDVDNDGQFDTTPSTEKTLQYKYKYPGNYLVRLKLIDPAGAQMISTPVSIKIPGEKEIAVESFTLIDADMDKEIRELKDGDAICLTELENERLNIRANVNDTDIKKVVFDLNGPIIRHRTEKKPPYALFGDRLGDFNGRKLLPGEYKLTATPYINDTTGTALSISFVVIDAFEINSFTLIDATTDEVLGPLSEGDVIDLSLLKNHRLSVQAEAQSIYLDKVAFALQGPIMHSRNERQHPYTLFGNTVAEDGSIRYAGKEFYPGAYTLSATAYACGAKSTSHAITFTVTTGEASETAGMQVEVYPIPASEVVNIKYQGNTEQVYIMLLDFNGEVLLQRTLNQQSVGELDVRGLRRGIHYLKVISSEGVQVVRLVLE